MPSCNLPASSDVFKDDIYDRMTEDLNLAGFSQRTAHGYLLFANGIKPSGTGRWVKRHATGEQFVRSFVQHILPTGFQKVRYYGFMSPNCKLQLGDARWLVWLWRGEYYWIGPPITPTRHRTILQPRCIACGGALILELVTNGDGRVLHRPATPQRGPPCAA